MFFKKTKKKKKAILHDVSAGKGQRRWGKMMNSNPFSLKESQHVGTFCAYVLLVVFI